MTAGTPDNAAVQEGLLEGSTDRQAGGTWEDFDFYHVRCRWFVQQVSSLNASTLE